MAAACQQLLDCLPLCFDPQEALACRTIAARGVLLVSTAHGSCLNDLLSNPDLRGLVGGVRAVTLGDKRAGEENKGSKVGLQ
jgi:stage III sporulation protein SpoIIIAA